MTTQRQTWATMLTSTLLLTWALLPATPAWAGSVVATGQTTPYQADQNDGIAGPVDVPDDGTLQRGPTLWAT